ncbi:MAG: alpha/beta hydrolase [Saprospiraceae bacterium]|nr:alpha/beta hydrolase [Saprospiraceae bacterium]
MTTTKEHIIKSSFNSKLYQLYVSLPKDYSIGDTIHYPVLYVLDGKYSFTSFHSIREVLDLGKEIKDVIIVAIDDDSQADAEWFAGRYNDFTPSSIPQSDTLWSKIMNIPDGKLKSGGAELFLSTLQNDIITFIDKHYKTSADRGISGHSLGGLFAGYCLVKKPVLFKRYGINSPSFWWNNNEMLSIESSFSTQSKSISANVFFSAGALEGGIMIDPMTTFTNTLKNREYKGLTMISQIFDGETHLSVVPACHSRTLKVLYGQNVK